ncbi:hypothetical protein HispidOSU_020432 [Sigmodon hispidus]
MSSAVRHWRVTPASSIYFEIVFYESGTWTDCSVYENVSLTLTWTLILIENRIQNVWKPLIDYEILTCSDFTRAGVPIGDFA